MTTYRRDALDEIAHRLHNAPVIRTICAWCGVLIHDGALTADGHESHGACPKCAKQWLEDARLPL